MGRIIRVVHVVRSMNLGGAETFIMNIYRNIDRSKMQFDFLCVNKNKAYYDDEIESLGGKIYYMSEPKTVGIYYSLKEITNIFKKNNFSAVHSHVSMFSGIVMLAAKIAKISIRISHSHSAILEKEKIYRRIYQLIMKKMIVLFSTHKISCGFLAGKYLFGNSKDTILLKNTIDLEKYVIAKNIDRRSLNLNDNELLIGHIGRFDEVKNHEFIIKIANELRNQNFKFKIILVGDGILFNSITKLVEEYKLVDYFKFVGIRKDIPEILKTIDVLILPSQYEGFPMVLVESQASGTISIVSTNVSSEVDLGFNLVKFISLDDVKKWAEEIKNLNLAKLNTYDKMKELGYDVKSNVLILKEIYCRESEENK